MATGERLRIGERLGMCGRALDITGLESVLSKIRMGAARHGVPIERQLSVRVATSARLVGRAGRGLAHDLSAAARSLNVVE